MEYQELDYLSLLTSSIIYLGDWIRGQVTRQLHELIIGKVVYLGEASFDGAKHLCWVLHSCTGCDHVEHHSGL